MAIDRSLIAALKNKSQVFLAKSAKAVTNQ